MVLLTEYFRINLRLPQNAKIFLIVVFGLENRSIVAIYLDYNEQKKDFVIHLIL